MKTSRFTALTTIAIAVAMLAASACSGSNSSANPPDLSSLQVAPAPPGSCDIDAIKMCISIGSLANQSSMPAPGSAAQTTYASANMPESVEFQIPAGQAIKLMCYYNPQHTAIARADATPESALTDNSVAYLKTQGFCGQK